MCSALDTRGIIVAAVDNREPQMDDPYTVSADLRVRGAATAALAEIASNVGPSQLLVNCAGVYLASTLPDFSWESYDTVMQVNLAAPLEACLAWLDQLDGAMTGRVVNVSSAAGIRGSEISSTQ